MFIDLTVEQRRLRDELRSYFADLVTPEEEAEMAVNRHGDAYRAVVRRMGRDGWLGVGWPKEYGGQGFGPLEKGWLYRRSVAIALADALDDRARINGFVDVE